MDNRELDRRVAEAMNRTVLPHPDGGFNLTRSDGSFTSSQWGSPHLAWEDCPRYSTDPACVGAMLEWAAAKGVEPYVWFNNIEWEVRVYADGNRHYSYGSTPSEALARAIAATREPAPGP